MSSPAGTRSGRRSRSSGSRCRASCIPTQIFTKAGARPGDVLVLSKPLGTGIVLAGGTAEQKAAAIARMRMLNRAASEALSERWATAVHAVTDVTGFGLAGHGWEMAERSGIAARVRHDAPAALRRRARGGRGGHAHGRRCPQPRALAESRRVGRRAPAVEALCFDPQTSGGLARRARPSAASSAAEAAGFTVIGEVVAGPAGVTLARDDAHASSVARDRARAVGGAATRSSSVSTRSGGARGRARCRSARRCCRATVACTRSATRRRSPKPSGRSSSRASPRGASRGRSVTRRQAECDEIGMADAQRLAAQRGDRGLGRRPRRDRRRRQLGLRLARGADGDGPSHGEGRRDVPDGLDCVGARQGHA